MTLPSFKERSLYLTSQVDQDSIVKITEKILEINAHDEYVEGAFALEGIELESRPPIELYIDSYGGAVYQGLGLIGVMEKSKTPIHTYVTGTAMSCGFMIFIAGHARYCYPYATLMYHQIYDLLGGRVTDIKQDLVETERLQDLFENIVVAKTKIKKDKLKKVREQKLDWYITPEEALRLGVTHYIL